MDVVTTSGDGTGIAADIKKVSDMKSYIKDTPLGIASGITIENVDQYLPYVDAFLVATGISKTFTELDADKVKSLRLKIEP
jgi:predicted TIM-barrel enzyme